MTNPTVLFRSLVVYALCIPAAIFVGYLMANPTLLLYSPTEIALAGVMIAILMSPLFMRFYHVWLLTSWNMSIVVFFLPGNPQLWIVMTAIGLLIAVLQYILSREHRFFSVPSVTWPLLTLAAVVILTAKLTGGIGLRTFNTEVYGGKRYFLILLAITGYFVFCSGAIPANKAKLYATLFFVSAGTMAIGSTAGLLPSSFNYLYMIFPVENLGFLSNITASIMSRSWGLAVLSLGLVCAMLARYGTKGILTIQSPHRLALFTAFVFIGLMGGFRSILIIILLTVFLSMYLEGLFRTRLLPVIVLTIVLGGALLAAFANKLPLSVQRSLAFLPVPIHPIAKMDAQASSEWRLQMWRNVTPEIPKHLLLGKGYLFSSTQDFMLQFRSIGAGEEGARGSELVGDFHNGPLSLVIPFGLPGVFAFIWLMYASARVLYRNHKYSAPELQTLNTFMYAYFMARMIFFFTIFGSLYSDLPLFTGLLGFSVSLNRGVASRATQAQLLASRAEPETEDVHTGEPVPA